MKAMIITAMLILGLAAVVPAQKGETVTLRAGQKRSVAKGDIKIKFVRVTEDSRCPEKSMCVRAGNATLEVVISNKRGSKTVTMNTTDGNHGDQYGGWAVNLVSLTQKQAGKMRQSEYRAVFSIERLQR
jgi:hypothetical protein